MVEWSVLDVAGFEDRAVPWVGGFSNGRLSMQDFLKNPENSEKQFSGLAPKHRFHGECLSTIMVASSSVSQPLSIL